MNCARTIEGDWHPGIIPENVRIDEGAYIETTYCFHRFRSQRDNAITLGRGASMYRQTVLDLGPDGQLSVGDFSLLNSLWIICDRRVAIGSHCLLAWDVVIMDSRRAPVKPRARARLLRQSVAHGFRWPEDSIDAEPVTIGDNVWIGFGSVVLPGVTIGNGSVVGARSVVTHDIPDYSVAVGNPARVVSRLKAPQEVCHA